jgi:malyl-CoA/(S)-citramalyl-CoA lyase
MSFKTIREAPDRLNRSELAVPGSQTKLFEKAARSAADAIFLDLEDAVAPADKPQARKNIVQALADIDWGQKLMSVRINAPDTHFMYRDIVDLLENCSERLDVIMIPKVGTAADVYAVDMLVTQIENAMGRKKRIGFELIIETALGMQNISEIAAASPRNESLHFGVADYAASTRARTTSIGGANPNYAILTDADEAGHRLNHWGDMWHYALSRFVVAARANGLRAIDGPYGNYSDGDGYKAAARRAAVLGCEGKWAIHPSQIALGNEVFSPSEADVAQAKRIIAAMAEAEAKGHGAVSLDGRLIDYASIRQAQVLVKKAEQIAAM